MPHDDRTLPTARRARRIAATAIVLAGAVDLLSALTPPQHGRLHVLLDAVPLLVPQTAAALVALLALVLLLLTRGILRGQQRAWQGALVVLAVSAVLHLVKGADVEEALASAATAAYLVRHRFAFASPTDGPSMQRGLVGLSVGITSVLVLAVGVIEVLSRPRVTIGRALEAVVDRLVGVDVPVLPARIDEFLAPPLLAAGFGLTAYAGWLLLRPVVARHGTPGEREAARHVVAAHGGDTLSFFALRDDKRWFFHGESVVAYAVINGVCLVSPDPAGPADDRDPTWRAFHAFADANGWSVAVLGATEAWLPTYRASGMRDVYIGDEAVVDCTTFTLDGGRNKGLRQAVNRIAHHGYRAEFFDPAHVPAELRPELLRLMVESRQGQAERGFSMTLGRMFDPDDVGLLLAVAFDEHDRAVALCQWVPCAAIDGYSLDVMRRSLGEHPNGLTDFLVVETIRRVQAEGRTAIALNFATMRAVLAGEVGDGLGRRVQRWALGRLSDSVQIDSLRRYNEKFHPTWVRRYAVYDAPEHFVSALSAVARAESVTELPLVGRFL
jgi:lysyl-tRNA synthetase class 2